MRTSATPCYKPKRKGGASINKRSYSDNNQCVGSSNTNAQLSFGRGVITTPLGKHPRRLVKASVKLERSRQLRGTLWNRYWRIQFKCKEIRKSSIRRILPTVMRISRLKRKLFRFRTAMRVSKSIIKRFLHYQ